jgi:SRSO17 transposase
LRADQAVARLHRRCWNWLSAGKGAKGERTYEWAWLRITAPEDETVGHHWLLARRNINDGELAQYRCWSPEPTTLATLVRVAGTRWCVERCFQTAKTEVGLDQHQVRRWRSWYRYTTLVMLAHAILAVIAARERERHDRNTPDLIPLSVDEIRHLFAKLITNRVRTIRYRLNWSMWRRRHQTRARTSHYTRRGDPIDRHPST